MATMFTPTKESSEKYRRNYHGTNKIPNVTMVTERLGDMFICGECKKSWNDHTGYSVKGSPIGMCLTQSNLKEYNLEIM